MRPLGVGVATLVRSFPNSQPFEPLASCALESRHYSEFFPTFSVFLAYLTLGFHRMYRLFVSWRLFSLTMLVFTLICSFMLMFSLIPAGRSCCTSTYNFVLFYAISVTFVILTDQFLFRIRPYFPQWALAHQVRTPSGFWSIEEYSGRVSAYLYSFYSSFVFLLVIFLCRS